MAMVGDWSPHTGRRPTPSCKNIVLLSRERVKVDDVMMDGRQQIICSHRQLVVGQLRHGHGVVGGGLVFGPCASKISRHFRLLFPLQRIAYPSSRQNKATPHRSDRQTPSSPLSSLPPLNPHTNSSVSLVGI